MVLSTIIFADEITVWWVCRMRIMYTGKREASDDYESRKVYNTAIACCIANTRKKRQEVHYVAEMVYGCSISWSRAPPALPLHNISPLLANHSAALLPTPRGLVLPHSQSPTSSILRCSRRLAKLQGKQEAVEYTVSTLSYTPILVPSFLAPPSLACINPAQTRWFG